MGKPYIHSHSFLEFFYLFHYTSNTEMKFFYLYLSLLELIQYLKMPDLEEKLDMKATIRCFEEMKSTLPEAVVISYDRVYKKMYKIVKNSDKNQILNIIENERPVVKEFVLSCYDKKRKKIPPYIADVISKYLEENVS